MTERLLAGIAPARALGIAVSNHWENGISLTAPLAPNLNDKGTAFAGSISSLLVLTGWALVAQALESAGLAAEVMVVKSATEYAKAVKAGMRTEASVAPDEFVRIFQELETCGRSRIAIKIRLHAQEEECAQMTAHYAVVLR
jgi:thioesterase domain-containing protein